MTLGRDPRETDLEYVKRALKRAEESHKRARTCQRLMHALNHPAGGDGGPVVLRTATQLVVPWWRAGRGVETEVHDIDSDERELMRHFFDAERVSAEYAARAYEKDAVDIPPATR